MRRLLALVLAVLSSIATAQWPQWEYGVLEWSKFERSDTISADGFYAWRTGDDFGVLGTTPLEFYSRLTGDPLPSPSLGLIRTLDFIGAQGWQLMAGDSLSTDNGTRLIFMRQVAE